MPTEQRFSTSKTSPSRFEFVSSGQKSRKFLRLRASLEDVADHFAELAGRFAPLGGGLGDRDRVVAEIGQIEIHDELAAVGVRIGAHPPVALGGERGQLRDEPAVLVEELLRPVAAHPLLQHLADARDCPSRWAAAPGGRGTFPPPANHRRPSARSTL